MRAELAVQGCVSEKFRPAFGAPTERAIPLA